MSKKNEKQSNSTADRVLLLLQYIAKNRGGITLAQLVKDLNIPKSTAHRLLETLTNLDFIHLEEDTERYSIGLKTIEIGVSGLKNLDIVDVATPYLRELAQKTGETSFLSVYNEGSVVHLYKVEGTQSIRTTAELGMRRPIHCTAVGKAIASTLSLEEVDRILEEQGTPSFTKNTITDRQRFLDELSTIRLQGIAIDREEIEIGLTCYAVPVYNYTGRVAGAISIGAPTLRMKENHESNTILLKDAGLQISRWLGFVPNMRTNL
ncbi:IclR family transcriptional regulator [Alteribacillus sp. JSM 102045]|uniref:IclR family transcriptional regulator n=1 Tax=Alteribacillus sp. JSM 102045 TaxID=1562101 RepID=UPI0035C1444F